MKKSRVSAAVLFLCMLLAACGLFKASDTPNKLSATTTILPQYRGVNLTGGDVAYGTSNTTAPVSGTDYLFVSHQDIDYLAGKGVTFTRLVFSWEIMQPTLNGPLASTGNTGAYMTAFVDRVNYLTNKGIYVLVEPHGGSDVNFVHYKGNLVGSAAVPFSAFADFWGRMAVLFKANPKVMYGLSNEPHDMSTMQWYGGAQAAITAIRAAGATQQIFVAGNGWTQPSSWNDSWYDTATTKVSNATGWATLSDPLNNLVVSVHTYFDANSGGGANDIAGPDILATRLQPVVTWARSRGLKVHLSEFGANATATGAQVAVTNGLKYMDANADVIEGWSWWTYGPPAWWGGYRFTLDPTSNYTVDDPKMAWLKPFFVGPTPLPVVDASVPDATSVDSGIVDASVDSSLTDAGVDSGTEAGACSCVCPQDASAPAPLLPFTVTATKTSDWGTGYCKQFYFTNPNTVSRDWKTMTIYLKDGVLRGPTAVWGGTFPSATATGTIVVTPSGNATIKPSEKLQVVGFCADYGPTKYVGTNGGLTY